jgi:hypothetical protein
VWVEAKHDFLMQLSDLGLHQSQHFSARRSQTIILSSAPPTPRIGLALEPPKPLHAIEERVQGPRAEFVTVAPKFGEHPLAVNWFGFGVVQDMHFPKGQKNFSLGSFHMSRGCA